MLLDATKPDEDQWRRILKKLVEKLGLMQAAKSFDVSRSAP